MLVGLRQLEGELEAYLDAFLALKAKLPALSSREARSIFVSGLAPLARAHLFGVSNVSTFERVLEEARKLVNEQRKPAQLKHSDELLRCFHRGGPGHWACDCQERSASHLMGAMDATQHAPAG